jgi:plasmid stabilization system protein ParE
MSTEQHAVKLTRNFERNLEDIERFLEENEATNAFDLLLDELADTVIPNLEHFPKMGRAFLDRPTMSLGHEPG